MFLWFSLRDENKTSLAEKHPENLYGKKKKGMLLSLLCDCLVFFFPKELMIENREITHCGSVRGKKRGSCSKEKMYYKIKIA